MVNDSDNCGDLTARALAYHTICRHYSSLFLTAQVVVAMLPPFVPLAHAVSATDSGGKASSSSSEIAEARLRSERW